MIKKQFQNYKSTSSIVYQYTALFITDHNKTQLCCTTMNIYLIL